MRLLLLDIETSPNTAYVWGLWRENIPLARLIDSGTVLCWSAKWLDGADIMFDSVHHSGSQVMLDGIHKLLDEADAVIHYNGSRFDIPTLNKEFLLHRMTPPSAYKQIDLLSVARNRFRFASNKLDYIASALGVGEKHHHEGFQLWVKCMNNDPEAWKSMEQYNKQDVVLLESVYYIFRPWIKNHPNLGTFLPGGSSNCPNCASVRLVRRGYAYSTVGRYQRFRCSDCGTWSRDRRITESVNVAVVSDKA